MHCTTCQQEVLVVDGCCTQCGTSVGSRSNRPATVGAHVSDSEETLVFPSGDDSQETLLFPGVEEDSPSAEPIDPALENESAASRPIDPEPDEEDARGTVILPIGPDDSGTVVLSDPKSELRDVDKSPDADDTRGGKTGPLELGREFGKRYHIIKLLGLGGMGAVYQAWDVVLGIVVALKVVRPEVGADPKMAEELDQRFKRELLLAREVTHKNVVRIHDLGEIDGIKYITMTFIDGEDLSSVLKREGKLPVDMALKIFRSVLSGILAAHEAGVVHRDLKPANIMIGSESHEAHLMDFGVARSSNEAAAKPAIEGVPIEKLKIPELGQTMAGAVVGTLEYMAPEQFRGKIADQRSDLYTLGLILYDLLHGSKRAKSGKSAIKELMQRSEGPPPSIRSLEGYVPEPLDRIITKCLQPDPNDRYQTSQELADDLDLLDEEGNLKPVRRQLTRGHVAAIIAGVLALLAGTWWLSGSRAPQVEPDPMSILIADIDNQTGDASFDGALEETLAIAMEGASFISAYPRARAQKAAEEVASDSRLDEKTARLVAQREGVNVILTGSITGEDPRYRISVDAYDSSLQSDNAKPLARARASADSKDEVLTAVGRLASDLRERLGDTAPESARLAASETFTSTSMDAMRAYAAGQDLLFEGKLSEALGQYKKALSYDPEFGRALSGMGVVYANLKQFDKAKENYDLALQQLDRMTERERYRTLGLYYLQIARNNEKAIENYQILVDLYPADRAGHANLALALLYARNFDRAVEEGTKAIELEPNNLLQRTNLSMYKMYAGEYLDSIAEAEIVLQSNPSFGYALFTKARSAAAAAEYEIAENAYRDLATLGGFNADLALLGRADLLMYRGRPEQAAEIIRRAIGTRKQSSARAAMYVLLAEAEFQLGDDEAAADAAEQAIGMSDHESVLYPAARVLLSIGHSDRAEAIALQLENMLQSQTVSYARLIQGEIALDSNRLLPAVESLRDGWERNDSWLAHLLLGRAYLAAGHFPEALGEFEICVQREGEALDAFLIDGSTIRYLPQVYYYQGRAQEGIGDVEAARSSYARYLEIRSETDAPDPMAAEASGRWSALAAAEAS